ncbi:MAG: hypothetical protein AAFY20_21040 [Cyanobacteria bacterium J06639_14]
MGRITLGGVFGWGAVGRITLGGVFWWPGGVLTHATQGLFSGQQGMTERRMKFA